MSLQKSTMNWTGEIPPDQPEVNSLAQGHTAHERIKTLSTSETTHSLLINSQLRLYLLQLWLYWNWDFILYIIVTLYLCIYISKLWLYLISQIWVFTLLVLTLYSIYSSSVTFITKWLQFLSHNVTLYLPIETLHLKIVTLFLKIETLYF